MIRNDGQVLKLNTANGQIDSTSCVHLGSHSFELPIGACVLDNSPNVLSVGKLCHDGWSLIWDAYNIPTLTSPGGLVIRLKVGCFVPYLDESDKLLISHHVKSSSKHKPRFQALPMVGESVEGPGVDVAVENVPFSPVDLEAGQGTPEPTEDVGIQSLREKALSKNSLHDSHS